MPTQFKKSKQYHALNARIFADFDNERICDAHIVGLSQTDTIQNFSGEYLVLKQNDDVYLYMPIDEEASEYVVSEGYIIANPYDFKPYRWCCQLTTEIEDFATYQEKFKNKIK